LIRGTNIKKIVKKLRKAGAKKVHVRIGCPPLIAPCYLGIDMRSKKEFIAVDSDGNTRSWDEIAEIIGADSLAYSSMKALRSAIIGDREDIGICTGCLDFPCGYPEDMQTDLKELSKKDQEGTRAYEC
jgi:amidophosphoribosyltransferase